MIVMTKRSYFFNNIYGLPIAIPELGITIPGGISNLFDLNEDLDYERIQLSIDKGTLGAAMENKRCIPVADPYAAKSLDGVIIRKPAEIQVFPSRTKFTAVPVPSETIFDDADDANLFQDEEIKPAREVAEAIQQNVADIEKVEATIRYASPKEKPIENRYIPPPVKEPAVQEKLKNDILMKYETCSGITADGKRCLRQAKKGKKLCGLHLRTIKTP